MLRTVHDHDDWNAEARGETPMQRADRAYGEILQEVRVAQTGVQILFAFLLGVAFTNRFATASTFQRTTMTVTILLTVVSAVLMIAPAAWHRVYFQQGRRMDVVVWGNRFALVGLAFLAAAMTGAVLLVLDTVLGIVVAVVVAPCVGLLFGTIWFFIPLARRRAAPRD